MNTRTAQARQILETPGAISQYGRGKFKVQSLTTQDRSYTVQRTGNGMVCECDDHRIVKSDCCHIKAALMFTCRNMGYNDETFRIMNRTRLDVCQICDSGNVIYKEERKNNSGVIRRYQCKDCRAKYQSNTGFGRMRFSQDVITQAIQMRFCKMSTRKIAKFLTMFGTKVSHVSVHNWTTKFSQIIADYLNDVVPRVDDRPVVRADEVFTFFSGQLHYVFASMDDSTRFLLAAEVADSKYQHNADHIMRETRRKIGRAPAYLVTDRLPTYGRSARRVFGNHTHHIADAGLRSQRKNRFGNPTNANYYPSNNKME